MENPFEIIIEKLTTIEMKLNTIESRLNSNSQYSIDAEVMSLNQLCEYYEFTKSFIYKQTSTREIPHYKKGKKLFFKKVEIDTWLFKNKVKTMEDLQREATKYSIQKRK